MWERDKSLKILLNCEISWGIGCIESVSGRISCSHSPTAQVELTLAVNKSTVFLYSPGRDQRYSAESFLYTPAWRRSSSMLSSVSCFGEIAKETSAALTLLGRRNAHDTLTTGYTLRKKKGGQKIIQWHWKFLVLFYSIKSFRLVLLVAPKSLSVLLL